MEVKNGTDEEPDGPAQRHHTATSRPACSRRSPSRHGTPGTGLCRRLLPHVHQRIFPFADFDPIGFVPVQGKHGSDVAVTPLIHDHSALSD